MKKVLLATLGLLTAHLFAQGGPTIGQKGVQNSLVTWTTGANTGKTRVLLLGGNVYLDTSTTTQAGEWKRIDNTADSCSQPFLLGSDSAGSVRPVWENRLWQSTRAVDGDSSSYIYRVQTRERQYLGSGARVVGWTPWTRFGANNGYTDVTVQDSVLMGNTTTTSKVSQYSFFRVAGAQARLCPDDIAATANAAADSIFADSIRVWTR